MRLTTILWYYVALVLIVITSLIFVDFTNLHPTVRLILILALLLLIVNPLIVFWSSTGGKRRLRQIFGSADASLELENEKLKKQLAQLNHEAEHLRNVDKGKSEFVAMTAHQLRTPLSAIKWTFHMIMTGELGPVTTDQRSFLEKGYDSAEKVIAVINEWLNLDYLEANKRKYQLVPTDIVGLIDGVAFEFNERVREKKLRLEIKPPEANLPLVEVDPIKFSMIIENLIDNAVKYTPNGGQIDISLRQGKLNNDPAMEVTVADTGIGIPRGEQDRLFQQFFRSSNAVSVSPRGSGLGLYIVKNLVEGHNGQIHFESEEGKGTKFVITIPLKQNKV